MPSFDRYWRLGCLEFVLLLAGGVALVVWLIIASGLPLTRWLDVPLPWPVSDITKFVFPYLLELIIVGFTASGARRRERLRWRMLHGQETMLPLSRAVPDTAETPDIAHEPLVIPLQKGPSFFWLTYLILFRANVIYLIVAVPPLLAPLEAFILSKVPPAVFPFLVAGEVAIGIAVGIGLPAWMIVYIRRMRNVVTADIVASFDGIRWRRYRKRDVFISWERMRLLEVNTHVRSQMQWQIYTLYGAGGERIEWHALTPIENAVQSKTGTPEETLAKQQALLALIRARTGLLPRMLSQSLLVSKTGVLFNIPWLNLLCLISYLLLIGFVTLDQTPYAWLNMIVAATLVACCGVASFGVIYAAWKNRQAVQLLPITQLAQQPLLPQPPADTSPDNVYVFAYGDRLILLILSLIVCVLMLFDFTPLILRPGVFSGIHANAIFGSLLGELTADCLAILAFIALIGIVIIVGFMTKTPATLYASVEDLRRYKDKPCVIIPWEAVASISASTAKGKLSAYTVTADNGIEISWPANDRNIARRRRGYTRTTAGELAALVAQRSGKRIIIAGEEHE